MNSTVRLVASAFFAVLAASSGAAAQVAPAPAAEGSTTATPAPGSEAPATVVPWNRAHVDSVGDDGIPHFGNRALAPAWRHGRSGYAVAGEVGLGYTMGLGALNGPALTMPDYTDPGVSLSIGIGLRRYNWAFTWRSVIAGARASETAKVGLAATYGFDPDIAHGFLVQTGIAAEHRFYRGSSALSPWARLGLGYESQSVSGSPGDYSYSFVHHAPQLSVGAGADIRMARATGFGVFAEASVARYGGYTSKVNAFAECDAFENCTTDTSFNVDKERFDYDNPGFHSWVTIGVRYSIFP